MIFHLICWVAVASPCLLLGIFIEHHSCPVDSIPRADRLITSVYIGLVLLSTVLLAVSLLVPVSLKTLVLIITGILALTLFDKHTVREYTSLGSWLLNRRISVGMAIVAALVAFCAADPIKIYDTGSYHYPLTRWLSTTGTVPGLALVYGNFGFTSSWFALAATLDHGPFRGHIAGVFNGLIMFGAIIHFSLAASRVIQRKASMPDWFLFGAYPVILALSYEMNLHTSLSPDLPVFVVTIIIVWRVFVDHFSSAAKDSFRSNLPILILGSGIVDLKLSAVPVFAAILLLIAARCRFRWRHVIGAVLMGCTIVSPLVVANIITSGSAFYPSPVIQLNFPWSLSPVAVSAIGTIIRNHARCNGLCLEDTVGWSWIVPWLRAPQNAVMVLIGGGSFITFMLLRAWRFGGYLIWILMVGESGIIYVLMTAPNARFAAGYISLCTGLSVALLYREEKTSARSCSSQFNYPFVAAIGVALLLVGEPYFRGLGQTQAETSSRILMPSSIPSHTNDVTIVKTLRTFNQIPLRLASDTVNGIRYVWPIGGDQCWGAELPCIPGRLKPGIMLRDPKRGLLGGFKQSAMLQSPAQQWRTGYYLGGSSGTLPISAAPFSKYTHVLHASLLPTYNSSTNSCGLDGSTQLISANASQFVSAVHAAGAKALVTVADGATTTALQTCTDSSHVDQFVSVITSFVNTNGYDGLDMDWEQGVIDSQFQQWIIKLRAAMPAPGKVLTIATTNVERVMLSQVQNQLDQINFMNYDQDLGYMSGQWRTDAGYNSSLYQGPNTDWGTADISVYYMATVAGIAPGKLGLGMPFYGRVKQGCQAGFLIGSTCTQGITDPGQAYASGTSLTNPRNPISYGSLVSSPYWTNGTKIWDAAHGAQYIRYKGGDASQDAFVNYMGVEQMQEAVNYMKRAGLGGIMTFELANEYISNATGDARYPLSTAMYNALGGTSTAAPVITTSSPLLAATAGSWYSMTMTASGTQPLSWSVVSGSLPSGLALNSSTGVISGTPTMANVQSFTVQATNTAGVNSKAFSLTTNTTTVNTPPVVSITPNTGYGMSATFTVSATDTGGYADVKQVGLYIGVSGGIGNVCYIDYWAPTNTLSLQSDNGSTVTSATLGSSTVLRNNQCSLNVNAATLARSGNTLTLVLPVNFTKNYTGTKPFYVFAADNAGAVSGWQVGGSWVVDYKRF